MVGGYAIVWIIGQDGLMQFAMVYAGAAIVSHNLRCMEIRT